MARDSDPISDDLAKLHDLRFPQAEGLDIVAEAALGLSLGLILAILAFRLLRSFLRPRRSQRWQALAALAESRELPRDERLKAQAVVIRQLAPKAGREDWREDLDRRLRTDFFSKGLGADLTGSLYRRGSDIDPAEVDRALSLLLKRFKG